MDKTWSRLSLCSESDNFGNLHLIRAKYRNMKIHSMRRSLWSFSWIIFIQDICFINLHLKRYQENSILNFSGCAWYKLTCLLILSLCVWFTTTYINLHTLQWKESCFIALDKILFFSVQKYGNFSYFSTKTYAVIHVRSTSLRHF